MKRTTRMQGFAATALLLGCFAMTAPVAEAHQGHTTRAPWEACAAQEHSASCAWTDAHHNLYRGTCRSMGGGLVCVRNQPIVAAPTKPSQLPYGPLAVVGLLVAFVVGMVTFAREPEASAS